MHSKFVTYHLFYNSIVSGDRARLNNNVYSSFVGNDIIEQVEYQIININKSNLY